MWLDHNWNWFWRKRSSTMAVVWEKMRYNCSSLPNAYSEAPEVWVLFIDVHLFSPRRCCISLLRLNFLAAAQAIPWKHHLHYHCTVGRWQCYYVSFYETEIITKRYRVQGMANSCFNQPSRREARSLFFVLFCFSYYWSSDKT